MSSEQKKSSRYISKEGITPMSRYEQAVDEFKGLFDDKTHPKNRTSASDKKMVGVINRLMNAAYILEEDNPGSGVFGLIILALRVNLSLKDKCVELEVRCRELERELKKKG